MADRRLGARWHALDRSERFLALLLPVFGVLAGLLVLGPILESPSLSWNDLRLAPPAALTRGYDLYYLPGDGPMLGHIYGPIAALTYLPVTLLPTPSLAIRAGGSLSAFSSTSCRRRCCSGRPVLGRRCLTDVSSCLLSSPLGRTSYTRWP